jgi:putative FmdB family regulatory protein
MPFYEYECPHCGHHEEALQKVTDKPLKKCPNCGKNGLRKLMSAPVFRLKGSGWYETDFKGDKDKQRNLAGTDKEESKPETKAETKPDAKADSAKPDAPKTEAKAEAKTEAKSETAKPAAEKASKSARKPAAARAKSKAKPARKARR